MELPVLPVESSLRSPVPPGPYADFIFDIDQTGMKSSVIGKCCRKTMPRAKVSKDGTSYTGFWTVTELSLFCIVD